jgi:regulator of sirC expression with transglutaminase-like and TPR domain
MKAVDPYEEFRRVVECPDDTLDLGRAALAIARVEYPQLDVAAYLARIDELAVEVSQHLSGDESGAHRSIAVLNFVLFNKHRFRGNRDDYFDAKNSFLNEVLERRMGIPITLSVLYMEVAQRVGLPLLGVGFPGHFLVKYLDEHQEIVIDPFDGGDIKTSDSLQRLLTGLYGDTVALAPRFLEPVTKKQILRRMLNNLKFIYLRQRDLVKALAALDRMMIAEPNVAEDLRERGSVYLALEYFPQAAADFTNYLRLAPDAPDASEIRDQLVEMARRSTAIH